MDHVSVSTIIDSLSKILFHLNLTLSPKMCFLDPFLEGEGWWGGEGGQLYFISAMCHIHFQAICHPFQGVQFERFLCQSLIKICCVDQRKKKYQATTLSHPSTCKTIV